MTKGIIQRGNEIYIDYNLVSSADGYSATHISGPVIQDPTMLIRQLMQFDIIGATIQDISFAAHNREIPRSYSKYIHFRTSLSPFVIVTDRGAIEIDFSESSTVMVARDSIQAKYYYSDESKKFRELFSTLKGTKIEEIFIREQNYDEAYDTFTGSYRLWLKSNQKSYIKSLNFRLSNGQIIQFTNDYDDGVILLLSKDESNIDLPKGFTLYNR